jgi:hypothetical protein
MSYGSILSAISSLKNNRSQVNKHQRGNTELDGNGLKKVYSEFTDHKKMSPTEFLEFQKKLQLENKTRQRKEYLIFGSVMILVIVALAYLLFFS